MKRCILAAALIMLGPNPARAATPEEVAQRFDEMTITVPAAKAGDDRAEHAFKYRLLRPADGEAGKTYPLVVYLHGAGERGNDNKNQLKYLPEWLSEPAMQRKYPCYILAPQCPSDQQWVDVPWGAKQSTPMGEPSVQMTAVLAMLERTLKSEQIDRRRVYLTGLSMGGYGSWDLAMRKPDTFAAVAPICGGGDERRAALLKDVPVWAWHGDKDGAVPVERSRDMIAAIQKAGGQPKYTEVPGAGHNVWTPAYTREDGVLPWLFRQRKSP